MVKYGVITDEISQDIFEAAELAKKFNLDGIEIRSVNDRGPHLLNEDDIKQIKEAMAKYDLKCCGISAPFFKCNCNEKEINESIEILKKCIHLAKELGTKHIRGFAFFKEKELDEALPDIIKAYKSIESILEENDVYLLLESDPTVNACCGEELAKVIKAINMDRVKGLWDPGNDIYSPSSEVPFPDGYNFMKGLVSHVHIKDAAKKEDGTIGGVPFGEGEVDFSGQLTALKNDGYSGWIVMETHYRVAIDIPEELLVRPSGSTFSLGGYEATEICLKNFFDMVNKIGL